MNKDLVLIKPPAESPITPFSSKWGESIIGECLGIAYISAYCQKHNVTVEYIDAYLENLEIQQLLQRVIQANPAIIGILLRYPFIKFIDDLSRQIKQQLPSTHIVIGGQFPSINAEYLLNRLPFIDSVCIGLGEIPMLELILAHREGKQTQNTAIHYRMSNIKNIPSKNNVLAGDDFNGLHPDRKYSQLSHHFGFKTIGISTSRGCPYTCAFCVVQQFSRKALSNPWIYRSAESIVAEMKIHCEKGENLFTFSDEHFLPHKKAQERAFSMAKLINKNGLELQFMFDCRADSVNLELFKELRKAGLYRVFIGIESMSQNALSRFNKKLSFTYNVSALEICKSLGIEVVPGLILFDPFTTKDELEANIKFINKYFNHFDWEDYIGKLIAISNTPIVAKIKEAGLLGDLQDGIYEWRFLDAQVAKIYQGFQSIIDDYKSKYDKFIYNNNDPGIMLSIKHNLETDLLKLFNK